MRSLCWWWLVWALIVGPGTALAQPIRPMVGQEHEHIVAPGETLYSIGQLYSLAIEHLAFANHLPVQMDVPVGTRLRIPTRRVLPANPPANGLVVNLAERGVYLFRGGKFEKFYPVAIGQPGRFATPTGQYTLASRVVDPTWLPPEWAGLGRDTVVPAGPDNPLGDRWMGLSAPGLGLHSTTAPTSIGQAASHGCMRMYPASARELFEKVTVGMPVRIEYEPVKLGRDSETGSLSLVVYPDVYGRAPLAEETERVLRAAGVLGLVSTATLGKALANPTGAPWELIGGGVQVTYEGQTLGLEQPALMAGGSLYLSSEVAKAMGLDLRYDSEVRRVVVSRQGDEVSFVIDDEGDSGPGRAFLVQGRALLPARQLLDYYGLNFRWESDTRTLHIQG